MNQIRSGDAEISCDVLGDGPPVVLLHPFPVHHEFWLPVARVLASQYRVILPDLRGHGESAAGDGPATMEKHAADLARICDAVNVGRAVFIGVSIGGYALFEFWRRSRGRVAALVLSNTKAQADSDEACANRLRAADEVLQRGTETFIESMLPKLMGPSTHRNRPDLVREARHMMQKMSPEDIAAVLRGMAERPDSQPMLKTVNVPTLIITGEEDGMTGLPEAELMRQNIPGARLSVIPKAGHYAAFEQPEAATLLFRQFLADLGYASFA